MRIELTSMGLQSSACPTGSTYIKLGTPSEIRTHRTTPFERVDFTNLSIGALVVGVGVEPTLANYLLHTGYKSAVLPLN